MQASQINTDFGTEPWFSKFSKMQNITFLTIGSFTKTANSLLFAETNSSLNLFFSQNSDGSLSKNRNHRLFKTSNNHRTLESS
jgi:hypothetical protein